MKKILIIFFIITGAYLLFVQSNSFSWWPLSGKDGAQTEVTNSIDTIEIDVSGASTIIIPDNDNTLRADLDGKGNVSVKKSGDKITVEFKRKWFESFAFLNKSKLTIYVPEDYDHDMKIEVGSGNLIFAGPSKNNPMELDDFSLDLSSGNVGLKNLKTTTFENEGSSGNLQIDSVTTEQGSFDISSGNVDVNHFRGELKAELSSGNLKVQMDKVEGDISIEVNSGKASLDLPNNADFTLNGEVNSGNIRNDFSLDEKQESKTSIKGTHGKGKHHIDLDVSSGNIDIY
jgi:lia operon protein LiaG